MQCKKCFLIAVLLFPLTGFPASFQPTRGSLSVSASAYLPPPVDWTSSVGFVSVCSVKQTTDNGYITVGSEEATWGGCWLEKTDEYGNSTWSQIYAQSGFVWAGRAVQQTADGGYVLAGYSESVDLSGLKALMVKTDEFGNVEWNKTYEGKGDAAAFSGQQTGDGGYALAGWTAPVEVNDEDFYLVKTDSNGNLEWNKTYGGSSNDIAWAMQQTSDGGCILAGYTYSFGAGGSDCFLVKTDSSGNLEWNRTYGSNWYDSAYSVHQTNDGGYVFAGFNNWDGGQKITEKYAFITKTNSIGEVEWSDSFYGEDPPTGHSWAEAYCVDETSDGGFVVTGGASLSNGGGAMLLLKTHSQGNGTDWRGTYIGYSGGRGVIQTTDGGYAVAGGSGLVKIMSESVVILARFRYSPAIPIINENVVFDASYSYDRSLDIVSYTWDFDDGNISTATTPVVIHRYDHSGAYNVSLMVKDAESLNSSCSELVNVPTGQPVAHFEYSPESPVLRESIVFDASSSYDRNLDIVSYLWNFDDGNVTSVMSPIVVHRFENAGIYNVSLTVVDAEGLNSSCSLVVCAKTPTSISISTSTPSATAGYSVGISGTLSDFYGNVIKNETAVLYYVYSGYENWNAIALDITDDSGNYHAEWVPPAPSYFVLKATYMGNYTHVESSRNVTLSMLAYGEAYLFSVESNSTVSSMGFDSNNQTLSFTATGAEGTIGYARVTAAKSLVPDLAQLSVHVDGAEYDYNVTDANDSWVLLFVYDHSAHLVEIQLDNTIPEFVSSTLLMLLMIATLFAAMVHSRKAIQGGDKYG